MELSEDARKIMENRIDRILKGIDVPENNKNDIKKELVSNYVDASMMRAKARGSATVEMADMTAAFETSEDPEEIASMYMASYAGTLHRAGLLPRTIAHIIDMAIIALLTGILMLPVTLFRVFLSPTPESLSMVHMKPMFFELFYFLVIANMTIVFVYFVICEGFFGYTPGKRLMGLKVLRADGKKASYREAMLRNIPKVFIAALVLDASLIVLYRGKERQRFFDRIAGTIVIRK